MNDKVKALLAGHTDGHLMPFFWQHGEDETTLRRYMQAIDEANCQAVCVESRPHPDFCGPKWWQDMDVILDEARRRGMKVWILDDSHFPTGYANGALKERLCYHTASGGPGGNRYPAAGRAYPSCLSLYGANGGICSTGHDAGSAPLGR